MLQELLLLLECWEAALLPPFHGWMQGQRNALKALGKWLLGIQLEVKWHSCRREIIFEVIYVVS